MQNKVKLSYTDHQSHFCRADKNPYRHDGRADKDSYRHDGRAYSLSQNRHWCKQFLLGIKMRKLYYVQFLLK